MTEGIGETFFILLFSVWGNKSCLQPPFAAQGGEKLGAKVFVTVL